MGRLIALKPTGKPQQPILPPPPNNNNGKLKMPYSEKNAVFTAGWLSAARKLPSPNFGPRPTGSRISLIVLHAISLPPETFGTNCVEAFFTNCLDHSAHPYFATITGVEVSAHFYLRRDGEVVQFVSVDDRAWHAGASSWQGVGNCNDFSVGIELEGSDTQPYTTAQYASLWPLLEALCQHYPINSIAGHCHIAPGRKTDPGPCFDWAGIVQRYGKLTLPPEVRETV